ncbi:MAG TPA: SRPBCC domain-containing protein [Kofleriaceae bacterium]|nr:SRPBCC domain-containing protein [Kofleriaceae bacterium]
MTSLIEYVHIDVHTHVGGMFSISQRRGEQVLDTHGTYRTLDRPHRLAFSWATPAAQLPEGLVRVRIEPRDGGSAVTLTHELDPSWAGTIAEIGSGWTNMLEAMSRALA